MFRNKKVICLVGLILTAVFITATVLHQHQCSSQKPSGTDAAEPRMGTD